MWKPELDQEPGRTKVPIPGTRFRPSGQYRDFDDEHISASVATPIAGKSYESPVSANVGSRRVPVIAIDGMVMGQPPDPLASISRRLKYLVAKRTRSAIPRCEVAYKAPAFVV